MGHARVLRTLWRHRFLVALGVVVAVFAGVAVMYRISLLPPSLSSRHQVTGQATARVLIAARDRPTFDLRSRIAETLPVRAELLADLLATEATSAQIARGAGLDPTEVIVLAPAMGAPEVPVPIAVSATEVAAGARVAYRVVVTAQDGRIPIVTVRAEGPDPLVAARVAESARVRLDDLIETRGSRAPDVEAQRLGPAVGHAVSSGPKPILALVATALVLVLWCFAIVVLSGLRAGRAARRPRPAPAPAR